MQPPEDFLPPRIEGDPRIGNVLTCTRGDWDDPATPYAVTYQWYRAGTAIPDATNATYTLTAAEASTYVQCRVRAEDLTTANSPLAYTTTQAVGGTPVNLIVPAISGDRRLRRTLTCSRGSWNDPATPYPVTYRWRRGSVAIPGQTTSTLHDHRRRHRASRSTARSPRTAQTTATSPSTTLTNPELILAPAVSGDPRLRQTLSCSRGTWHDDATDRYAITYRWLRNSTAITGATSNTYTLTPADVGTSIDCEARAENLTAARSAAVGVTAPRNLLGQVVSGQPRLRKTMTCSRGTWDDIASDAYAGPLQWLRDNVAMDGKTGATYDVVAADTGHSISCTARAENLTSASPVNGAETVRAPENKVLPRLTGAPRLRQTLQLHARRLGRRGRRPLRRQLPLAARRRRDRRAPRRRRTRRSAPTSRPTSTAASAPRT